VGSRRGGQVASSWRQVGLGLGEAEGGGEGTDSLSREVGLSL